MCLIAFNWQPDAPVPLIIAANRDEFYARPTLPLHRWQASGISAGQDLQAGGTWLGVSDTGRIAALTNLRDPAQFRPDAKSRGDITTEFLTGSGTAKDFLGELSGRAHQYNPFNLLVFDGTVLMGFESRHRRAFLMDTGVGAVSNADFHTPWPKLKHLRAGFADLLQQHPSIANDHGESALFELLADRSMADIADLPQTGIPLDRERALSAAFIRTSGYGTRASTIVWACPNRVDMVERSFDANGFTGEVRQSVMLQDQSRPIQGSLSEVSA